MKIERILRMVALAMALACLSGCIVSIDGCTDTPNPEVVY